jgi:hypothetical protein
MTVVVLPHGGGSADQYPRLRAVLRFRIAAYCLGAPAGRLAMNSSQNVPALGGGAEHWI